MKQTYNIITYGCQMNKSDSERIASVLESSGFKKSSLNKADYAFLNLCSVRQSAIDRIWGKINQIKKDNKKIKIVLTGCILPDEKKKLQKKADYLLDIKNLMQWPILKNKKDKEYFCAKPKLDSQFEAYVPIMTGCNNFCSYCAVPYTRGREKSRPAKDILNEVNKLVVQGYKFITLLGQNVNSYCQPAFATNNSNLTTAGRRQFKNKNNFPKLLKQINKIPGDYWLSFVTSHPKDMSDELIKSFKNSKHLIPYLHLPIQSGSNKILKVMNRKYTSQDYLKLIDKVKKINPDINLSTDIIVGFPGETKKDFKNTVKMMKKVKYDMAYIAQYSPRPNTKAETLEDNISKEEKKQREKILTDILKITALEKNKKMVDKTIEVLIENKKDKYYLGKTRNFKNVKIKVNNNKNLIGKFVDIEITKANTWNLEGKITKANKYENKTRKA